MAVTHMPAHGKRRALPADIPVRNGILAALLATEYKRLLPKLEHVALRSGEIIYRADQDIDEVYFPEEAVVATVDTTNVTFKKTQTLADTAPDGFYLLVNSHH